MTEMEVFGNKHNVKAYAWFELIDESNQQYEVADNIGSNESIQYIDLMDIDYEKLQQVYNRNENWMKNAIFIKC